MPRVFFAVLSIVCTVLIGLANPAPAEQPLPGAVAAHYNELLVAIMLNGVNVTDAALVLKDDAGAYYAGEDDVTAWNLVKTGRRSVEYNGQRYFALDDFKTSFDASRGLLSLTAAASVFTSNTFDFRNFAEQQQPTVQPKLENGGFLNYDIAHHFGTQGQGLSGSFNGADTVLGGVATASVAQPGNGSGFVRLGTAYERDDPAEHTVLKIGDTVEAGGVLPLQRQFGGFQWGTDFALTPSFIVSALPVFSGALPSDGTLDVIINGREVSQQQIPAGPFVLQNLLVPAGSGNVTLVLRDAAGQVQTIVSPYYQSPVLLRQGVSQFEFDAGSERQGYGIDSFSYDGMFVSAQGRRGVNNRLTLGAAVDESAHAQMGTLAAVYVLPVIGQLSATLTGRSGLDSGLQQTYTYSYSGRHFVIGGQLMASSPGYRSDVCQLPCITTTNQLEGSASLPTGKGSSLALSYAHSITSNGVASRSTSLGYVRRIWRGALNISVLHSGPSPDATLITAAYGMPLGGRGYGSASAVKGNGESNQSISYNQSLPSTATGFGYQLQAQASALGGTTFSGGATEQLENATVSQQFFHGQDSTFVSTDVAGSIDFVDHGISFARTIGGGFGVVELPGYAGVPVYANGQEVGRTNALGRLILPQLQPYQENDITLGAEDLPIGVDLVTSSLQIAPYGLSPGIGRFTVKSAGGVSLTVVDSMGTVLPAGTKVVGAGGEQQWVVALDGMLYLDGVLPGDQRFTAATATASCSFELSIPKNTTELPDLGRTVCR